MADFVIIGGGGYGAGVAWELARRGADVHLLEAKTIACGASGGLGKRGVRANGRDVRELPFMKRAYEIWPVLHEQLEASTGYERSGHLLLLERDNDLAHAKTMRWMQEQQGIPSRWITQEEVRELEPHLTHDVQAAVFCPLDGIADHTATTQAYARAAARLGALIEENTPVSALEIKNEAVTAVMTAAGRRIEVNKQVLLLSNAHVPGFLAQALGINLPVWELLPQVMLTELLDPMPINHLIGHAHRTLAMKACDKQIMISGGWRGRENPITGQPETQHDQVEGNRAEATAVYPILAGVGIVKADASRREMISVDGIPIIDQLPAASNMIFATGWSGHGWAITPAVVELLADWALTGKRSPLFEPFRYTRFF